MGENSRPLEQPVQKAGAQSGAKDRKEGFKSRAEGQSMKGGLPSRSGPCGHGIPWAVDMGSPELWTGIQGWWGLSAGSLVRGVSHKTTGGLVDTTGNVAPVPLVTQPPKKRPGWVTGLLQDEGNLAQSGHRKAIKSCGQRGGQGGGDSGQAGSGSLYHASSTSKNGCREWDPRLKQVYCVLQIKLPFLHALIPL